MTDLIEHRQFTCPRCGGHEFGSSRNEDDTWTRICHGRISGFIAWVLCAGNCRFQWHESDDQLYFRGTGIFTPRYAVGAMVKER